MPTIHYCDRCDCKLTDEEYRDYSNIILLRGGSISVSLMLCKVCFARVTEFFKTKVTKLHE